MRTLATLTALALLALPASPDLSWQSVPEWATPRQPYNGCCETLWALTGKACGAGAYAHGPVSCLSDEDADTIRSLGDKAPPFCARPWRPGIGRSKLPTSNPAARSSPPATSPPAGYGVSPTKTTRSATPTLCPAVPAAA